MGPLDIAQKSLGVGNAAFDLGDKSAGLLTRLHQRLNAAGCVDLWHKARPLQITVVNLDPRHTLMMQDHWFNSGNFWDQPFWPIRPNQFQTFCVCDNSFLGGVSGGVAFRICAVNPDEKERGAGSGQTQSDREEESGSHTNTSQQRDDGAAGDAASLRSSATEPLLQSGGSTGHDTSLRPDDLEATTRGHLGWFVCTFANPRWGSIKGMCSRQDPGNEKLIKGVWKRMKNDDPLRSPNCGFYRGNLPASSVLVQTQHADRKLVFIWKPEDVEFDEVKMAHVTTAHNLAKLIGGVKEHGDEAERSGEKQDRDSL